MRVGKFFCYSILALLCTAPAGASTSVSVTYSHRLSPGPKPPTGYPEGGIEATFTGAGPITPVSPPPDLVQLSDRGYRFTFAWDDTTTLTLAFVDTLGDTTTVAAKPEPPMPLNLPAHSLPVFHILTDLPNLWDPETGIYIWGNHENCLQTGDDWERSAEVRYYRDGTLEFDEPIGLRIHGNSSRRSDQRGLRLYFDDYGEEDDLVYDLFNSEPHVFQRLILRTGRYASNLIYSNLGEILYRDIGHLTSRYTPVSVYLNDDYWGIYCLRERYDDEFVEATYNIKDDYVMLMDGQIVTGEITVWTDFLESFSAQQDCTSHEWFQWVSQQMDLQSYIDWLFINILGASGDNGYSWNVALLKVAEQPWQFLMWDEDGIFRDGNMDSNHFLLYTASTEAEFLAALPPLFSHPWWDADVARWNAMFRQLMHNSEFKALLKARIGQLLNGTLSVPSIHARLADLRAGIWQELPLHSQRWPGVSPSSYDYFYQHARDCVAYRHALVQSQFAAFHESYRIPVELSRFAARAQTDVVSLEWRTESEEGNQGFVLYRAVDDPEDMVLLASYGANPALLGQGTTSLPTTYQYTDDAAPEGSTLYYQLRHVSAAQETTTVNWIEAARLNGVAALRLNELMAENSSVLADEAGEFDDWFEIYNPSPMPVELDSLYVTDDPDLPTKHMFSGGLAIPAGGHLLFWADSQLAQGNRHVGFKLSAEGEHLLLVDKDGITVIDQVQFLVQRRNHVFQRFPDGEAWTYAWDPTPGQTNAEPRIFEFLSMNELMSQNVATITDGAGDHDPWLEIWNPLPVPVSVAGLKLSTDPEGTGGWAFPSSSLPMMSYQLVWLDGEPAEGPFHASLTVSAAGGFLGLFAADDDPIDVEDYPALDEDQVYARLPDGGDWYVLGQATPGAANPASVDLPVLVINEFLADNDNVNQDEAGQYDDWLELYNPGPAPAQLLGLYLTDNLSDPLKWPLPAATLEPGAYLLVWCDEELAQGPFHADFKLSVGGEAIGLFASLGGDAVALDTMTFGAQTTDVSQGRLPDGADSWTFFPSPTPGFSNVTTGVGELPLARGLELPTPAPNPFNPRTILRFNLPADGQAIISIYDMRGRLVATPVDRPLQAGWHEIAWTALDARGRQLPAGAYVARLEFDGQVTTRSMVLVR